MKFEDEVLIAYVDGELDSGTRAAVDAAAAQDAGLAARLQRQRLLRNAVHAAYEPVLEEPMPRRLLEAASEVPQSRPGLRARRWSWFEWSAMAASLAVGVLAGAALLSATREEVRGPEALFVAERSGMLAHGALAKALSEQLASTQPADAPVKVGLSFLSKSGAYCRTFTLESERGSGRTDGLACRSGGEWRVPLVAEADRGAPAAGPYRTAGSGISAPVLRALEERIEGEALDANAERAAMRRGWVR